MIKKTFVSVLLIITTLSAGFVFSLFNKNDEVMAYLNGFDPGNIISDAVMSNKNAMSVNEIQNFLNSKVPNCTTEQLRGYNNESRAIAPCLKDFKEDGKTAAQILWQAGQDYSINPQVLIVLLQKEQGLVTDTWPRDGWWWTKNNLGQAVMECTNSRGQPAYCVNAQYRSATGYGCPDTAPCDAQYFGFINQTRKAAELFRVVLDGGWTNYPVGNNYIQYNPDPACGGSIVNIKNRATSALYRYTPYQPNAGALAAGWGTAHCGAYGNRNFYNYFTEWFGSTKYTTVGSIDTYYKLIGGEKSILGLPIDNQKPTARWGYYQRFENGYIIGKWDTGYWATRGSIRTQYALVSAEHGVLGFPIADEQKVVRSGNKQNFEYGYIVGKWDTGYWTVRGSIRTQYDTENSEGGKLGFPISNESPVIGGGHKQLFENGSIIGRWDVKYWSISGKVAEHYKSIDETASIIGYPIQPELITKTGSYQRFENGYIMGDNKNGYWVVRGNIRAYYASIRAEHGVLGFPKGLEYEENGQYRQNFENGYIIGKHGIYNHHIY